jgi:hypothetical protein
LWTNDLQQTARKVCASDGSNQQVVVLVDVEMPA